MALAYDQLLRGQEGGGRMRDLHFAILRFLVDALVNDKRYEEALERSLEMFARAVQAEEEEIEREARTTRGKIYLALGDTERARDCFFTAGEFTEMAESGYEVLTASESAETAERGREKAPEGPSVDRVFNDLNDARAALAAGKFEAAAAILTRLLSCRSGYAVVAHGGLRRVNWTWSVPHAQLIEVECTGCPVRVKRCVRLRLYVRLYIPRYQSLERSGRICSKDLAGLSAHSESMTLWRF